MVRRTKQDADATRSRLLDAAEQVFYDKGMSRASLNDIACAAGATRGAIYWHFKDKGDLFNAMMDRVTLPLQHATDHSEAFAQLPPMQRVRDRIDFVHRSIVSDERMRRVFEIALFRIEYVDDLAVVRDLHIEACGGFQSQLEQDLKAAAADQGITLQHGSLPAAIGLRCVFDGLLQAWLLNHANFDLVAISRMVVDTYLRGLGFRI
ncbi:MULTISPECIES: TetR family transcriptional regulator [unclassified Acidovorax]|uniref:TetR family transcriptional regulator n=1 Tax=unclassified Acidovorax TaxID=2684926 RepID=UPI0028830E52|nr:MULTISPECIES: TetR family transcriptional regulator [unclassified Acidovorax]